MNPVRARAESLLLGLAAGLTRAVGTDGTRRLGHALGSLWHALDGKHRRIARQNLHRALPALSEAERRAVAQASFRHFGWVLLDLARFPCETARSLEDRTEVTGWEHLEEALSRGKGALVFSAHYGNWELVALLQGFRGRPMDMITRPMDNPAIEAQLARARAGSGNRVVHKRNAVRGILTALREERSVAIVIDQNFRDPNRVFVDFFGSPAATTPTLGVIAARTGAPVVPVFSWPQQDGRYRIDYHPPVKLEPSGDRTEEALRMTRACTRIIEEEVRRHPEYWLWMHQRWRTRPLPDEMPAGLTPALPGEMP